jgi:hypothetical protein
MAIIQLLDLVTTGVFMPYSIILETTWTRTAPELGNFTKSFPKMANLQKFRLYNVGHRLEP